MKSKMVERVIFMMIGAVLAIVGFMFGKMNTNASDTSQTKVFDRLKVRNLVVSGKISLVKEVRNAPVEFVVIEKNAFGPSMTFQNERRRTLINIGLHGDASLLSLNDPEEENRITLKADATGSSLTSFSETSDVVVRINTGTNGDGGLTVISEKRNAMVMADIVMGTPILSVSEPSGNGQSSLSIQNGDGVVKTRNRSGRIYNR